MSGPLARQCCDCGQTYQTRWPACRRCDQCHELLRQRKRSAPARTCTRCSKPVEAGRRSHRCVACAKEVALEKKRARGRSESSRAAKRAWAAAHRSVIETNRSRWRAAHREQARAYKRHYERRARSEYRYNLLSTMRSRVAAALKASRRRGKAVTDRGAMRLVGCSIDALMRHLESLFEDGMTWGNFGRGGWHIDHVYPVGRADMSDAAQVRAAFNWQNCRPLWARENLRKNAKVTRESQALFDALVKEFRKTQARGIRP
jgi:hypothetical protein